MTAQPAIEIPDRPTAMTIIVTAAAALHSMKPVATRQTAGPMNPTAQTDRQTTRAFFSVQFYTKTAVVN